MGLMDGGRKKSMGVFTAGRLARLLLVLTSSNITEIMFGLISLMQMTRERSDQFQYQVADCVAHIHLQPTCHGVNGRSPMQGGSLTLVATSASVPPLWGGFN